MGNKPYLRDRLSGMAFVLCVLLGAATLAWREDLPDLVGDEAQAAEVLAAAKAGTLVLDVRKRDQYASRRIPGAVSVTLEELEEGLPPWLEAALDSAVIVYCNTGKTRSLEAKELLELAGFRNVINLVGGIRAWIDAGYPVAYGP